MAKAKRVLSTPRRTSPSSKKSSPKSATVCPGQVDAPAKVHATPESPFGAFGQVEGGYLKLCAEWHLVRAQQRLNWAKCNLQSAWDRSDDGELDLRPLERMKDIEGMLEDWQPRTMAGVRRLVEICLAIQVHAAMEGRTNILEVVR